MSSFRNRQTSQDTPRVAAILAGGRGSRLDGVVDDTPKCLIEIQGHPFIEYQLAFLRRHGIEETVLLLGHKSQQVIEYLGDGKSAGMRLSYSIEPSPLGTAGAVKHAQPLLREPFLLLNGDTLVDVDLERLWRAHQAHPNAWATLSLCEMDDVRDYGRVEMDAAGRVLAFREKQPESRRGLVNAGVYCFTPKVLDAIPPCVMYSVETQLLPALLDAGHAMYGHRFRGEFVDIGTRERLLRAQEHPLFQSISPETI